MGTTADYTRDWRCRKSLGYDRTLNSRDGCGPGGWVGFDLIEESDRLLRYLNRYMGYGGITKAAWMIDLIICFISQLAQPIEPIADLFEVGIICIVKAQTHPSMNRIATIGQETPPAKRGASLQ